MIIEPLNDRACLGKLSQLAADGAQRASISKFARSFKSTRQLARFIRTLPQRDDKGNDVGPSIVCDVPQRARQLAADPNCFERSLFYLSVAEAIDPEPMRQLTTIDTPVGRHTFPVEDGLPVVLDPVVTRNVMHAGFYAVRNAAGEESLAMYAPDETLNWIADLAEGEARNQSQLARVARARESFWGLLEGQPIERNSVGDIGYALALANRAAPMWGPNARRQVGVAANALQRTMTQRNFSLSIPGVGRVSVDWKKVRKLGSKLAGPAVIAAGSALGLPPTVSAPLAGVVINQLKVEEAAAHARKMSLASAVMQATDPANFRKAVALVAQVEAAERAS